MLLASRHAPGRYRLITLRSNDQFNTTIYGFSDRLRGIEAREKVLLINPEDMVVSRSLGWSDGFTRERRGG